MSESSSVAASSDKGDDKRGILDRLKKAIPTATERQKLIPLAAMFFCILFNYTILRDTKDVLMVTAPKSGAEVIPFIKTYVNLPVAIVRVRMAR
jgi:AAA family ATP:ADP antiporter